MQDTEALLGRLADIEMPPAPTWTWLWIMGAGLLLAGVLLWWWRRSRVQDDDITAPPADACSELERLQARWSAGELADRETAYRLATILRLGLALPRLTTQCPAQLRHDAAHWQETITLLQSIRYQKTPPSIDAQVFERARRWLTIQEGEPPC